MTMDATHNAFLDHPIVHGYVAMRIWGHIVQHLDVVAAEIRSRTQPGATVLSLAMRTITGEINLAAQLPDREFFVATPSHDLLAEATAEVDRRRLTNIKLYQGTPEDPGFTPRQADIVVALYSVHYMQELEAYWTQCRDALRSDGTVIAQEYVGPNSLQWTAEQLAAANGALSSIVPAEHKQVHEDATPAIASAFTDVDPRLAVRSRDVVPSCEAAGFEIVAKVGAGCALLHPVLLGQIESYDPTDWSHNMVLASLFREEDKRMKLGTLGDDFAMFIASPR